MKQPMRLTFFALLMCLAPAAQGARERGPDAVIRCHETLRDVPGTLGTVCPADPDAASGERIYAGTVVRRMKIDPQWTLVDVEGKKGWMPTQAIVALSRFTPVRAWKWPRLIEVGDGDYAATYRVRADGRFAVRVDGQQDRDENFITVRHKGQMYGYRNLMWPKVPGERLYSSRMLVKGEAGIVYGGRQP
ncbi:hypothetical protein CR152_07570 [Massilia violaceinigra]|uniref:SH3b domain-containing protein n=1 Tax=Massilia violaceinigra TaxID=2045208 RepID=A0A2D2DHC8_9BURK|nr:hypothetical protein [Massilia violaceinigra]ATQ74381.1 hypothetical protein CR152_07570 [Massilia violaceinigra]